MSLCIHSCNTADDNEATEFKDNIVTADINVTLKRLMVEGKL